MTTLGKLTLCFACFAAGVVTAESYRRRNESALPSAAELRVVYFDPDAGLAVEVYATEADVSGDGTVKLCYGGGAAGGAAKVVRAKGVVVIRPRTQELGEDQ